MNDCLFCRIAAKEMKASVVYEDKVAVAFEDINPQAPVHILLIPREHIAGPHGIDGDHEAAIGHLFVVARRIAEERGIAENGYRLVMNSGADAGQTVFHAHLHLLGGRAFAWPPG